MILLQAMVLLPLVALSLSLLGFKVTQRWLSLLPCPTELTSPTPQQLRSPIRMVQVAAKYQQLWANCLKRSLVLWTLLRFQGIPAHLRIGVNRQEQTFVAHAWVCYDGKILNDSADVEALYQPFEHKFEAPLTKS